MGSEFDPRLAYRMVNPIQPYEWGSPTAIPELLGTKPDGKPQAELWMGAHPKAPSGLIVDGDRVGLPDLIERYPEEILGRGVIERFGNRLPFLFKVLAAARALSIQAHPNLQQAREGFRRENEAGVPLRAPERDYQDDNHKPEVICALSDFWGMCGFRSVTDIHTDLVEFRHPALDALPETLQKSGVARSLREFLRRLLEMRADDARAVVAAVAEQCQRRTEPRFGWVRRLAVDFPGDPGVLAPLFLNVVHLHPGEAIYLKAGELHAYLEGTGIELMANSDNVLRGGLTKKHIDVDELLRVLNFEEGAAASMRGTAVEKGLDLYATPISEFRLAHLTVGPDATFDSSPIRSVEILLCVRGEGSLSVSGSGAESTVLHRGDTVLVPAAVDRYSVSGEAELFRADVPVGDWMPSG